MTYARITESTVILTISLAYCRFINLRRSMSTHAHTRQIFPRSIFSVTAEEVLITSDKSLFWHASRPHDSETDIPCHRYALHYTPWTAT